MLYPIDLTGIHSIGNLVHIPKNYVNPEEMDMSEEPITQQYISFLNLGSNLLDNLDDTYKNTILSNMLEYVNDTYLPITDLDTALLFPEKILEVGSLVYGFVCVDCFNTIIPNLLNLINCNTVETFDSIIQNKYKSDYNFIKINIIKLLNSITEELLKLQRIDSSVQTDVAYQNLLYKFSYYTGLIDFCDAERFVNNYIRPILIKNLDSILWRII
jgi:hypothetical protein